MSSHDDSFVRSGSSPTGGKVLAPPDIVLVNHGSVFLLRAQNEQAIAWVDEHIGSENGFQPYWPTVVIGHRYTSDIVEGIRNDGLAVS